MRRSGVEPHPFKTGQPNHSGTDKSSCKATLEQIAQEAPQPAPAQRADLADFLVESLDSIPPDEIRCL